MADTIRSQGVLSPLLVRPLNERGFEIVFGARRYRAAQMAEVATVPVRIKNMTDAEVLEAQLIENLQRRDVHPMEEAEGYKRLLTLDEPKYSIEQIAAKVGKTPVYIAQRLKLTELCEAVVEAFYRSDIGVGHALMLAKLPATSSSRDSPLASKRCIRKPATSPRGFSCLSATCVSGSRRTCSCFSKTLRSTSATPISSPSPEAAWTAQPYRA